METFGWLIVLIAIGSIIGCVYGWYVGHDGSFDSDAGYGSLAIVMTSLIVFVFDIALLTVYLAIKYWPF